VSLSALVFLAAVHGLQGAGNGLRCPEREVALAQARVEADERAGRHWSAQGLLGLARRVCRK